jgi:hypothetical protein
VRDFCAAAYNIPEVPITWTRTELIEVVFGVPFFFGVLVVMFQVILGRTSLLEIIGSFS